MEEIKNDTKSYRSILKATSIFGGVQIWKILLGMVNQKFIAILIGTEGMGITGLYNSGLQFIQGITAMGLSQSAVKNVAEANSTGDKKRVGVVVSSLRMIVWLTGLLGAVSVIVLSPWLSKTSFGNYDYALPFALLSVTLLLNQLSVGQSVVLQGLRKIRYLAKAGLFGSLLGLVTTVPIYYFFRIQGIVPTIIIHSATTLLLTWYFSRKVEITKVSITWNQAFHEGKEMMKMGIALSFNSMMVLGVVYITRVFIGKWGGIEQVGLYVAGTAIVNTYAGLVFSAMSTDYYPRLASYGSDNNKCSQCINQQAEIGVLLLTPILLFFLLLVPFMVVILYSEDFLPVVGFMQWALLGTMFKTISWAISFVFIAKGAMKPFLINEILIKAFHVPAYLLGYYEWGLNGLGVAFVLNYILYTVIVYFVAHRLYGFKFSNSLIKLFSVEFMLVSFSFAAIHFSYTYKYVVCVPILAICIIFTFIEVKKRTSFQLKNFVAKLSK